MTYAEAEIAWWTETCLPPPVDQHGRWVFFGVRCPTPPPRSRECTVPVRPGFGGAAFAAGCEDEWIDVMAGRYGEGW